MAIQFVQTRQYALRHLLIASGLLVSSISAQAAVTGNVGVLSDYYARGLDQTGGVTVQGGIDYAHTSGLYVGSVFSNVKWFDKNKDGTLDTSYEWDFYAGYANKIGALGYDVGVLNIGYPDQNKYNTLEFYAGLNTAFDQLTYPTALSAKVYYSPDRNAYLPDPKKQDKAGWYSTAQADIKLTPTVTLTPQVGYAFGPALEKDKVGGLDDFINYSLTLNKALEQGFSASFSVVDTDIDGQKPKVVVGVKKAFDF